MSDPYEEFIEGESYLRFPPGPRHELICARLHSRLATFITDITPTKLLPPRSKIQITQATSLRPDLALVSRDTAQLWLAVEIVNSEDHRADTVTKKSIYEDLRIPRLWMVDPRYDNVEIYRVTEYGLALQSILAGKETLSESDIPGFSFIISELFSTHP